MPHEAKLEYQHSVHPPPFLLGAGGEGVEPPAKFSEKGGGLDSTSTFRWDCWERGA